MVRQRCKREKLTASRRFRGFLKLTPAKMKSADRKIRLGFRFWWASVLKSTGLTRPLEREPICVLVSYGTSKMPRCGHSIRPPGAFGKTKGRSLEIKWARVSSSISFLSTIMIVTSHYDDLTIPELFHALKQRLCGISSNCIRCVALFDPSRTHDRVTLTCVVSSNSSGLDLQEVREIDDESR